MRCLNGTSVCLFENVYGCSNAQAPQLAVRKQQSLDLTHVYAGGGAHICGIASTWLVLAVVAPPFCIRSNGW